MNFKSICKSILIISILINSSCSNKIKNLNFELIGGKLLWANKEGTQDFEFVWSYTQNGNNTGGITSKSPGVVEREPSGFQNIGYEKLQSTILQNGKSGQFNAWVVVDCTDSSNPVLIGATYNKSMQAEFDPHKSIKSLYDSTIKPGGWSNHGDFKDWGGLTPPSNPDGIQNSIAIVTESNFRTPPRGSDLQSRVVTDLRILAVTGVKIKSDSVNRIFTGSNDSVKTWDVEPLGDILYWGKWVPYTGTKSIYAKQNMLYCNDISTSCSN